MTSIIQINPLKIFENWHRLNIQALELSSFLCNLHSVLSRFLLTENVPYNKIICKGKSALIELKFQPDVHLVIPKLQCQTVDGLVLSASRVELKTDVEATPNKPLDVQDLEKRQLAFVEALEKEGFFSMLGKTTTHETKKNEVRTFFTLCDDDFKTIVH